MASKGLQRKLLTHLSKAAGRSQSRKGEEVAPPRVKYREYRPHKSLVEDVKCFWILENDYPDGSIQEVSPDGCVELIFNFGSPYVPLNRRKATALPPAFVVGFQNRTIQFRVSGTVRIVATRMFPWAALQLLHEKVASLSNRVTRLGSEWSDLVRQVGDCALRGEYDQAVLHVQDFLIRRALVQRFDRRVVQAAAKIIHKTKGQFRIGELAEYCRLSVRQLQRGFKSAIGATPKVLARTVRFVQAQRVLMFNPSANLTDLTYECGYFDQAHFIKDFKDFTGKTPSEYAKETKQLQRMLKSKEVVFLPGETPTGV